MFLGQKLPQHCEPGLQPCVRLRPCCSLAPREFPIIVQKHFARCSTRPCGSNYKKIQSPACCTHFLACTRLQASSSLPSLALCLLLMLSRIKASAGFKARGSHQYKVYPSNFCALLCLAGCRGRLSGRPQRSRGDGNRALCKTSVRLVIVIVRIR